MLTWHLTFSGDGRQALFPSESARIAALGALVHHAGGSTAGFCVVDDHVHLLALATRQALPQLRRCLLLGLRAATEASLDPAHVRHVDNRRYQQWVVDYLLRQPERHRLPGHPALWTGSSFLDLAGARRLEGLSLQLHEVLPRYRLRTAFRSLGLGDEPLEAASDSLLATLGAAGLARAAAAAVGAPPGLRGKDPAVMRACRLASQELLRLGFPAPVVGLALGRSDSAVRRLRRSSQDARDLQALRLRVALEERVRGARC